MSAFDYRQLIKNTKGRFFSVEFIKKDGTIRKMLARTGVKIGVKGTGKKMPEMIPVMRVWDVQKSAFRCIPLDRINWLKSSGVVYV